MSSNSSCSSEIIVHYLVKTLPKRPFDAVALPMNWKHNRILAVQQTLHGNFSLLLDPLLYVRFLSLFRVHLINKLMINLLASFS